MLSLTCTEQSQTCCKHHVTTHVRFQINTPHWLPSSPRRFTCLEIANHPFHITLHVAYTRSTMSRRAVKGEYIETVSSRPFFWGLWDPARANLISTASSRARRRLKAIKKNFRSPDCHLPLSPSPFLSFFVSCKVIFN